MTDNQFYKVISTDPTCIVNTLGDDTGQVSVDDLKIAGLSHGWLGEIDGKVAVADKLDDLDKGEGVSYPLTRSEWEIGFGESPISFGHVRGYSVHAPYYWVADGQKWIGLSIGSVIYDRKSILEIVSAFYEISSKFPGWRVFVDSDGWVSLMRRLSGLTSFYREAKRFLDELKEILSNRIVFRQLEEILKWDAVVVIDGVVAEVTVSDNPLSFTFRWFDRYGVERSFEAVAGSCLISVSGESGRKVLTLQDIRGKASPASICVQLVKQVSLDTALPHLFRQD